MAISYAKLRDGNWGIRADVAIKSGQTVAVRKKSGEVKQEVVGKIVWQGDGITLATIQGQENQTKSSKSSRPVCAECGKPGELVEDLEDGLMKHHRCCDMPL